MEAVSDECEGCDVKPVDPYTCDNPPCDSTVCGSMAKDMTRCTGNRCSVECSLERGYYPDNADCTAYCYCSGEIDTGSGIRVPSRWMKCPRGTFWDKDCGGWHQELANGIGYKGGCCNHAFAILNFANCPGACERLSKYHCGKSQTCNWDDNCNCCKSGTSKYLCVHMCNENCE